MNNKTPHPPLARSPFPKGKALSERRFNIHLHPHHKSKNTHRALWDFERNTFTPINLGEPKAANSLCDRLLSRRRYFQIHYIPRRTFKVRRDIGVEGRSPHTLLWFISCRVARNEHKNTSFAYFFCAKEIGT